MSMAIFILATALVTFFGLSPLLRARETWLGITDPGEERRTLEAEKESYLRAMKDIEFEHASSKINDQDYQELRRHYGAGAARTIRRLEELENTEANAPVALEKKAEKQKQLSDTQWRELVLEITVLREKIDILENDWDVGEINDDEYTARHDAYNEELESLLKKLENRARQHG
ncbi:hypothetical protein [Desulfolithobacter sp.]